METLTSLAPLAPILGIFGAVIGAVVGAWFTRRMRDPRPTILVDHLEIAATSTRAPNAVTATNRELIISLEDDPFVGRPSDISSATVREQEYVTYLRDVLGAIEEAIDHKLPTARTLAEQLRDSLATDDYESFERIWAQDQDNLWSLLYIGTIRDDFSYSGQAPDLTSPNSHQFRQVVQQNVVEPDPDNNPRVIVTLPGAGRDISFEWWGTDLQHDKILECAMRTANAFAWHIRDDLVEAVRFFLNGLQYEAPLRELRDKVKDELRAHNRLLLKGQISNTGGSPFAVLNNADIFVETTGYPYNRIDSNGDIKSARYEEDTRIRVLLAQEQTPSDSQDPAYTSPISVGQGTTNRFIAVSEQLIKDVDRQGVLLDVYNAGERTFYLGSWAILPGSNPQRAQYTAPQLFRDWKSENKVPPNPSKIRVRT